MSTTQKPTRVLVVDDSPLVRRTVERLLDSSPGLSVVGSAADGLDALAKVRALKPDVVTLDIMMPRLDGLKVLACLMRDNPVRVVMLSSLTQEGADVTLQALDLGAVDFVDKGVLLAPGADARLGDELVATVRTAVQVDPARLGRRASPGPHAPPGAGTGAGADVVVIGASTGGPPALQALVPALPADLAAGVIVVQHIPAGFTRSLAARMDAAGPLTVREAETGDRVRPGEVLVAPGGQHLSFARRSGDPVVIVSEEPKDTLHRPSVDVTMQSAAEVWKGRAAGVLLTGMGSDGAWGMWAIRSRGGHTIAESEETAVVYGMPRAAVELGAVAEIAPLGELPERIAAVVRGSRPS